MISTDFSHTLIIFAVSAVGLVNKNSQHRTIIAGVLLYLLYTVYIGGDFMSGRFFSAPLLACTALLSSMEFRSLKTYSLALGLVLLIGIAPIYWSPERSPSFSLGDKIERKALINKDGITDERIFYTGLGFFECLKNNSTPATDLSRDKWIYLSVKPVKVKLVGALGLNAMTMGPNFHVIDHYQ